MTSGDATKSSSITFSFSATDGSGVSSFNCKLDGASYTDCNGNTNGGTGSQSYTNLARGVWHTFNVRAVDNAGNTAEKYTSPLYSWFILG